MNATEDRLRHLLAQAAPDLGSIDPDALLAPGRAQSRRPRLIAVAASAVVIAGIAAAASALGHSGTSGRSTAASPSTGRPTASQPTGGGALVAAFPDIPTSVFDAVGAPSRLADAVTKLDGPALTANGKPEVLYVGADWAPYDAAERWALAAALSRFGTLTNLADTASSAGDVDPNTATVSFHGARYASDEITAVLKDIQDHTGKPFEGLTASEETLFTALSQGGSFPFIDIAGRYKVVGTQLDPAVLAGLSQSQIADALSDPRSPVAKAIIGPANVLTAAICEATGDQPTTVCSSEAVTAASRLLDTSANRPTSTTGTK
jgi:hypothetical protein